MLGYAGEHELALSRCLRVPRATLRDRARRYTSCVGCINAVHLLPLDRAHPLLEDVLDEDGRVHAVRLRDMHASSMDKVSEALLSGKMMDSMGINYAISLLFLLAYFYIYRYVIYFLQFDFRFRDAVNPSASPSSVGRAR